VGTYVFFHVRHVRRRRARAGADEVVEDAPEDDPVAPGT
jgi:hypothetical protein